MALITREQFITALAKSMRDAERQRSADIAMQAGRDYMAENFDPAPVTLFERTDEEVKALTKPFDPSMPIKRIGKIAKF
jgi:hypothetical protein